MVSLLIQVCEKSIRGETLYKIHLTTPGHIKVHGTFTGADRCAVKVVVDVAGRWISKLLVSEQCCM